jgi:N-acetylglucosamine-6-phosphate deacetylase
MLMKTLIHNIDILPADGPRIDRGALVVENGRIAEISGAVPSLNADRDIDGRGLLAVPGFVDLHIQGGGGACVMDGTAAAIDTICRTHARHGTTGLLLTPIPDLTDDYRNLRVINEKIKTGTPGARILGVHLEGPFLNPAYTGAFTGREFTEPSLKLLEKYLVCCGAENVRMMTIAPELPGAFTVIEELVRLGMIASLGHTHATYAEARQGFDLGATHVTHFFNAMRPFHHREPGLIGAALLDSRVSLQLVCDGFHLHPAALNLAVQATAFPRLNLITDAMRCADLPDGAYQSFGKSITLRDHKVSLADGTIAGSALTMEQAVQNMRRISGLPLAEVLKMASFYPAQTIGLAQRTGSLAPGKDADVVLLDQDGNVQLTMVAGEVVYADNRFNA